MRALFGMLLLVGVLGWLKPQSTVKPAVQIDFAKILENLDRTAAEQARTIEVLKKQSEDAFKEMGIMPLRLEQMP